MSDRATRMMLYAVEKHAGQVRKYTGEPYVVHLAEVAGLVAAVAGDLNVPVDVAVAVAWGHDLIEDTDATYEDLLRLFGHEIALGVSWLTDSEVGNRRTRKELAALRLLNSPPWVKTIKLADLISNTKSIALHDPHFAVVYLSEKERLLPNLKAGNATLFDMATDLLNTHRRG